MHEFKNISDDKVLIAEIKGKVDLNEGAKIISEFQSIIREIDTNQYTFILCGKTVVPASLFIIPMIQKFIKLCYSTPFKRFFFIGDEAQNSYARNLIKSNNSQNKDIKILSSMEEAMQLI